MFVPYLKTLCPNVLIMICFVDGSFCACTNSNTNTYSCVRNINSTHNYLYCEFVSGTITYYNLKIDPHQVIIIVDALCVCVCVCLKAKKNIKRLIQWGSEYQTGVLLLWSKQIWFAPKHGSSNGRTGGSRSNSLGFNPCLDPMRLCFKSCFAFFAFFKL